MAEPVFALKIGCFTCFCLNGTDRLEDMEHEFRYSPEHSPSSLESYRSSQRISTRRRRRGQPRSVKAASSFESEEATPRLLGRSLHSIQGQAASLPCKGEEAAPLERQGTGVTLLERRPCSRLEAKGASAATSAKGGALPGGPPSGSPAAAAAQEAGPTPAPAAEAAKEEAEAVVAAPAKQFMDLSGSWVLARIEGDMDAWLKDIGVSWAMRTAAKTMKYGVGKMTNEITMTSESIQLTTWTPKGDHTSVLKLDGSESRNTDPMDGKFMLAVARWEGSDAIYIQTRREANGEVQPTSRRFLKGDEMCVEQITPKGLVAKRWFVRN